MGTDRDIKSWQICLIFAEDLQPDEEAEKIQTVGAAVDYVVNLIKSKSKE